MPAIQRIHHTARLGDDCVGARQGEPLRVRGVHDVHVSELPPPTRRVEYQVPRFAEARGFDQPHAVYAESLARSHDSNVVQVVRAVLQHEQNALGARTQHRLGLSRFAQWVTCIIGTRTLSACL